MPNSPSVVLFPLLSSNDVISPLPASPVPVHVAQRRFSPYSSTQVTPIPPPRPCRDISLSSFRNFRHTLLSSHLPLNTAQLYKEMSDLPAADALPPGLEHTSNNLKFPTVLCLSERSGRGRQSNRLITKCHSITVFHKVTISHRNEVCTHMLRRKRKNFHFDHDNSD